MFTDSDKSMHTNLMFKSIPCVKRVAQQTKCDGQGQHSY